MKPEFFLPITFSLMFYVNLSFVVMLFLNCSKLIAGKIEHVDLSHQAISSLTFTTLFVTNLLFYLGK